MILFRPGIRQCPRLLAVVLVLLALLPSAATAQPSPLLVRDLVPGSNGSAPRSFTPLADGAVVLFTAETPETGRELWRSDGTAAGTTLLADLTPGPDSTTIAAMRPFQDGALFVQRSSAGVTLWRTSGLPGSTAPMTTLAGLAPAGGMAVIQGLAYFTTIVQRPDLYAFRHQLWRSDGTAAGTWAVAEIENLSYAGELDPVAVDGQPYAWFRVSWGMGASWTLRRLDSTTLTTVAGCSFGRYHRDCSSITAWRGGLVMDNVDPPRLRIVQGGTARVLDLSSLPITTFGQMGATEEFILFEAADDQGVRRLWRTDGTLAGTQFVLALDDPGYAVAQQFVSLHGLLYFDFLQPGRPRRLWRSDGTVAGTRAVTQLTPGSADPTVLPLLTAVDQRLIVEARTTAQGTELWEITGRDVAPRLLVDLAPGTGSSVPGWEIVSLRGGLFWGGSEPLAGAEPRFLPAAFAPYVRPAWAGGPSQGQATIPLVWGNDGTETRPVRLRLVLPPALTVVRHTLGITPTVSGTTHTWAMPALPPGQYMALLTVQLPMAPMGATYTATMQLDDQAPVAVRVQVSQQHYVPLLQQGSASPP